MVSTLRLSITIASGALVISVTIVLGFRALAVKQADLVLTTTTKSTSLGS